MNVIDEQDELFRMILAIQNSNEELFSTFYDKVVSRVYALANRILLNRSDAEEVVCDVFTQIWQQAKSYHPEKGSVIAWCMVITRSRALDNLRKKKKHSDRIQDAAEFYQEVANEKCEPDKVIQMFQKHSEVRTVLESLSGAQRQLLALSFFKGLSHQEISDATSLPLGTVKSNIRRALEQLQSHRLLMDKI